MEEAEVPLEQVHEHIEHHAHLSPEKWVSYVALGTAILAALAAVASLLAGDHANEAMLGQIQSSDQWGYYQAKGIKAEILNMKLDLAKSLGQPAKAEDESQHARYVQEQAEIKNEAEEKTREAELHLHKHGILARSVTLFQIAIAVAAISILTKRQPFWVASMVLGLIGLVFLLQALLTVKS
jgi:hypothetical protein